ncbi:MAG: site-specific DNA-methyltransferase [Burkholderiales bacterium]|nr:site-specific DNA-methyltransferase [Burkholderiales bacterium]
MSEKLRSSRNRTVILTEYDNHSYKKNIIYPTINQSFILQEILNKILCGDLLSILDQLPSSCVDLLIIDPPYNLDKQFGDLKFTKLSDDEYINYLISWLPKLLKTLKPNGSVYICGDWKSSSCIYQVIKNYLNIQNRITWQREKGRGAKSNWKNSSEDIWFATASKNFYFDVEAVKQKRKVIAPYKENGKPKDWQETPDGNFRLTYPSNFWDDISIPYWSMSENTEHPTQKPEKLIAKLILASSRLGDIILDPFLGSGTTAVVAKKLNRNYIGIELHEEYCLLAEKRLAMANVDKKIQGYTNEVFWERNSLKEQLADEKKLKDLFTV